MTPIDWNRIAEGAFWLVFIYLVLAVNTDSWPFNKRD